MSVNIYNKSTDTLKKVAGVAKLDTWTGTQAEFDALDKSTLSDNCYINITDDIESGGMDKYSTEETVIGEWIDGKPLYRRVIAGLKMSFSATSTEWQKLSTSLDIDIEFLVTADVYRYKYKVPTIIISGIKPITYHNPAISWSDCDKLVLEYTKTTD